MLFYCDKSDNKGAGQLQLLKNKLKDCLMMEGSRIQEFCKFLSASPSPYHAVQNIVKKLESKNFIKLKEATEWKLTPGSRYYVTRNSSSIIAFTIPSHPSAKKEGTLLMIVGAHCDSPCLKLKVNSARGVKEDFCQLGVETYGGGLWHTWFDRDLGLAGRILYNTKKDEKVKEALVNIDRPILRIPTLAIHLDRSVSEGFKFNNEFQLQPIYALKTESESESNMLPLELKKQFSGGEDAEILGHDLCLYEVTPACQGGLNGEFILSGRLDNLFMTFCAIEGLLLEQSGDYCQSINVAAIFDNEEVGSQSPPGADSNFLPCIIEKISACLSQPITQSNSLLVSADMAHAVHPNYSEKHDQGHRPQVNGGLVIKHHSGCRYATTSRVSAAVRAFCKKYDIGVQDFMVRNDSPCGSTIGPLLAAKLGIPTIDVGMAQLSMHSIREMAGTKDLEEGVRFCTLLFSHSQEIFENLLIID